MGLQGTDFRVLALPAKAWPCGIEYYQVLDPSAGQYSLAMRSVGIVVPGRGTGALYHDSVLVLRVCTGSAACNDVLYWGGGMVLTVCTGAAASA
eukprot:3293002-Rhodomonas_salina.1